MDMPPVTPPPPVIEKDFQTRIFEWCAKNSQRLISYFWFVYLVIFSLLLVGSYQIFFEGEHFLLFYDLGKKFGQAALALLGIVVLPGILGRFKVEIKITRVITLLRRQIGITVFLLAFSHYMLVRFLPTMTILPLDSFQIFGLTALVFLFVMFLTSNNWSVRNLGPWWKKLHRIIYVVLWLLVLHVGLQKFSVWTTLIGFFAVLEVASLVYDYWSKKKIVATPQV